MVPDECAEVGAAGTRLPGEHEGGDKVEEKRVGADIFANGNEHAHSEIVDGVVAEESAAICHLQGDLSLGFELRGTSRRREAQQLVNEVSTCAKSGMLARRNPRRPPCTPVPRLFIASKNNNRSSSQEVGGDGNGVAVAMHTIKCTCEHVDIPA